MSAICAGLGSKGKVGVQRGRETVGVPSFLPPPRGAAPFPPSADGESPAEVQRKTPRPERANPPAAVRVPRSVGTEKKPPGKGEPADAVRVPRSAGAEKGAALLGRTRSRSSCAPVSRCRERSRPVRANTLTQFACPGPPVQKTSLVFKLNCFFDNATAKRHTQAETA